MRKAIRLTVLLFGIGATFSPPGFAAPPELDIETLLNTATELIENGTPDSTAASRMGRIHLAQKVTSDDVHWLAQEGAGPKTLVALNKLLLRSSSLPLPLEPVIAYQPPPSAAEIDQTFKRVSTFVNAYLSGAVDFSCTEKTHIYLADPFGWSLTRKLQQNLSYYKGKEIRSDARQQADKPSQQAPKRKGSWTQGEFAETIQITFAPSSKILSTGIIYSYCTAGELQSSTTTLTHPTRNSP